MDFITNRPLNTLILNTGMPQGCILSTNVFSLFTNNFTSKHSSNTIVKFAVDTTVVGLISIRI